MLKGLIVLFGFQLLGDCLSHWANLPIPGAILGTLLLLTTLMIRGTVDDHLVMVSERLLPLLPLFLIPASVGVIAYWPLVKQDGIALLLAIVISLLVAFLMTPWLFSLLTKKLANRQRMD